MRLRPLVVAAVAALALAACTTAQAPAPAPVARGDVVANLWMWNWASVAKECTERLGPDGYGAVQVAPPQDSLKRAAGDPVHPWWEIYQPASYQLTSRMGDPAGFAAMTKACNDAGVDVIVDAVLNHMTGQGDTSYGGTRFTRYVYPGLWNEADFHHYPADCDQPSGEIQDYTSFDQVTRCSLLGLADLATGDSEVRLTLTSYLNSLVDAGASGFRVDAAKHIGPTDLAAILGPVKALPDGAKPYLSLEVIPGGGGDLEPPAYTPLGQVLGFQFAYDLKGAFEGGQLGQLKPDDDTFADSASEATFVQNHDTERGGQTLSFRDDPLDRLAHAFLLAYGYGRPQVYSSFAWTLPDDSPPAAADGLVTDAQCGQAWTCLHRDQLVTAMVRFHNQVAGQPVTHWYDDGAAFAAFGRGSAGFVAVNAAGAPASHELQTGLPEGSYCDLAAGVDDDGGCTGSPVEVAADGKAALAVPASSVVALSAAYPAR